MYSQKEVYCPLTGDVPHIKENSQEPSETATGTISVNFGPDTENKANVHKSNPFLTLNNLNSNHRSTMYNISKNKRHKLNKMNKVCMLKTIQYQSIRSQT